MIEQGKTDEMLLRPRQGFNSFLERERFYRDFNRLVASDKHPTEAAEIAIGETEKNILSYYYEYLALENLLPFKYSFDEFCRVAETTLSDERGGATKEATCKIRDLIKDAPVGSMAVMTSPRGWSGLKDDKDREITYPDSQTIMVKKTAKETLQGFTLVSDMEERENLKLLKILGRPKVLLFKSGDEKERLASIVREVVMIKPQPDYIPDYKDIIAMVKEAKVNKFIRRFNPYRSCFEYRSFENILSRLNDDQEALMARDQNVKTATLEFREYVCQNIDHLVDEEVKEGVLDKISQVIFKIVLNKVEGIKISALSKVQLQKQDMLKAFNLMELVGGCNGGGMGLLGQTEIIRSGFGPRVGVSQETTKNLCKRCNQIKEVGGCGYCGDCAKQMGG